jgi:hypothetical protein
MPHLEIYQSLWAMELRRPDGVTRSVEESFAMVAEAGYAGMCLDLVGESGIPLADSVRPLFAQHGLKCLLNAFPRTTGQFRHMLEIAKEFGCPFLNVVGRVMPISIDGMVAVVRQWVDIADQAQMPVLFETHRHGITNDLFTTLHLLDAVPEMRLCADLSHYLVDREFRYPLTAEDHLLIDRVLRRAHGFQGRIASNEQIQVQFAFAQHQKWLELFLGWWRKGFDYWRRQAKENDCLTFLSELGPSPYAITDAAGYELSDRWEEALQLRELVLQAWMRVEQDQTLLSAGRAAHI